MIKLIDKIFCKLFGTDGGFEFSYTHFSVLMPYKGYKWYPIIHLYDNTWFKFFECTYKSFGCQFTIWNHHKYWTYNPQGDCELQDPSDDYTETSSMD